MAGQLMFKTEVTPGTGVTPDKAVKVLNASVVHNDNPMTPEGIGVSFLEAPSQLGAVEVTGQIGMELPTLNIETLLKHVFGSVNTTGSGPYTHTYTWATARNLALTIQAGVQDSTDTIQPFTATGCKFTGMTIETAVREYAKITLPFTAMNSTTGTALASASYQSATEWFDFAGCVVTSGGSQIGSANSTKLVVERNLRAPRHVLGQRTPLQALNDGKYRVTGEATCDFDGLTFEGLRRALTQTALVYTWTRGAASLTVTCNVQFTGSTPTLSRNGLEEETLQFRMVRTTNAAADSTALSAVLVNAASSAA